jgi:hypothetical protein
MSRNLFRVLAAVTLVLATFVAPAAAAPPSAEGFTMGQEDAGLTLGGQPTLWLPPIQPNGGCESGGAGGCPL